MDLAGKRMHPLKRKENGQFLYHEGQFPGIAVRFKSDVRLIRIQNAFAETRDALDDQ